MHSHRPHATSQPPITVLTHAHVQLYVVLQGSPYKNHSNMVTMHDVKYTVLGLPLLNRVELASAYGCASRALPQLSIRILLSHPVVERPGINESLQWKLPHLCMDMLDVGIFWSKCKCKCK